MSGAQCTAARLCRKREVSRELGMTSSPLLSPFFSPRTPVTLKRTACIVHIKSHPAVLPSYNPYQ